jgi:hypothetical protein
LPAVPALAISPAGTVAVTLPALTSVVFRGLLGHLAVKPETNLEPVMVGVNVGPPWVALLGVSAASEGTGLGRTTLTLILAVAELRDESTADAVMVRAPVGPDSAGNWLCKC